MHAPGVKPPGQKLHEALVELLTVVGQHAPDVLASQQCLALMGLRHGMAFEAVLKYQNYWMLNQIRC